MNFDSQVLNVPVEDIVPNRFQTRLVFEDQSLRELADSIRQHGIIQPLVLRRLGEKYEIIAGERRYKAAKMAGLTSVPAVITRIDDKKSAEVTVAENVQRSHLSSIEEARSYKALLDQGYMTVTMLSQKIGVPENALKNKLNLLTLTNEVQEAIMKNKISERHGRSLLKVSNAEEQNQWLKRIIQERLTVKQLDDLLKEAGKGSETMNINDLNSSGLDSIMPTSSITLGDPRSESKMNDLEAESANMNVEEPKSIFDVSNSPNSSSPAVQPIPDSIVDNIETLDFNPAPSITPVTTAPKKDVMSASMKISNLINELRNEGYDISFNMSDAFDKLSLNIDIKK